MGIKKDLPITDKSLLVIPAGIEPALPDWESGVLTVRRWDQQVAIIVFLALYC